MIVSHGIITGVDNSVTTVIAWRHFLIAFRLVGPATRTRSQRRARSESRAVQWDQSPACAAAARPRHRCCDRKYPPEFGWPATSVPATAAAETLRERPATTHTLLSAIGVALGSNSLRQRRSSCQPSNRYPRQDLPRGLSAPRLRTGPRE